MPRRFTGVIALEGVQTGDGRIIAEGALTWADLPLPLAWLQEEQHSMPAGGVTVGIIDTISRGDGGEMPFAGIIDDETPEGAEIVRRMDAGLAPFGSRWGVSIDADDYEVELVAPDGLEEDADVVIIAAAAPAPMNAGRATFRAGCGFRQLIPVTAAAGEDDPEDGEVLMEASADEIIERATRLRIRGATLCAVPAFDGAYIELDAAEGAEPAPVEEPVAAAGIDTAGLITDHEGEPLLAAGFPITPPRDWFENPHLDDVTPFTIGDDGRVFGHIATFGTCHTGYADRCQEAPTSGRGYAVFLTGEMRCREGCRIPVGTIAARGGHMNNPRAGIPETLAHYDDTDTAAAFVAIGEDDHGIWVAGTVRPDITDEQLVTLRASKPSGDWRPLDGRHELVAVCMVNSPGFPVPRSIAASGAFDGADDPLHAALRPLAKRELVNDINASTRERVENQIVRTS